MLLKTDQRTLYYFPADSSENSSEDPGDVPRFAIQLNNELPLSQQDLKKLSIKDKLEVRNSSGKYQVYLNDNLVGVLGRDRVNELKFFKMQWDNGLKMINERRLNSGNTANYQDENVGEVDEQINNSSSSLSRRLSENKDGFIIPGDLILRAVTWNLFGKPIYENSDEEFGKLLILEDGSFADLYFFCFQETVPLTATNLHSSPERVKGWVTILLSILNKTTKSDNDDSFISIKTNRLLGLTSIVLAKQKYSKQIGHINTKSLGTGLLGVWANKGSISIDFKIGSDDLSNTKGLAIQFLNCHLASGASKDVLIHRRNELFDIEKKLKIDGRGKLANEKWIESYNEEYVYETLYENQDNENINSLLYSMNLADPEENDDEMFQIVDQKKTAPTSSSNNTEKEKLNVQESDVKDSSKDTTDSIIFVCGDLNYRIFLERTTIDEYLDNNDEGIDKMLKFDGLSQEKQGGKIFLDFKEGPIKFKPTYKFKSLDYDLTRSPAYTDRILYTDHEKLDQTNYNSIMDFNSSDHKPVVADFKLSQIPLIDYEKRSEIMSKYFKETDKLENDSRPTVEISDLDLEATEVPILAPTELTTVLKNNGDTKLSWELIDLNEQPFAKYENEFFHILELDPKNGDLPIGESATITIRATLPIGLPSFSHTSILRVHNAQDFFISYKFTARDTYFGKSLDLLNEALKTVDSNTLDITDSNSTDVETSAPSSDVKKLSVSSATTTFGGIPKQIYQLVDFLSGNSYDEMFDFEKAEFYKLTELEIEIMSDIDANADLDIKRLDIENLAYKHSATRAVSKILLILLNNLEGGVVPPDIAIELINSYYSKGNQKLSNDSNDNVNGSFRMFKSKEDIVLHLSELLPGLRANVLIFLCNFLKVCYLNCGGDSVDNKFTRSLILEKFKEILISLPMKISRKKMVLDSRARNLKKRRNEIIDILIFSD
ncbi:hypothetical protein PACTADRAFT_4815 [Pachysolen tannophilus NRRL Y-2460]|uniref:Inositol polyphosphate-related phosphatase domain-containing protein n=1 Tax=Pachysolen tannophilus NRRL Y-2460 TaxID=669874 RepID=A0A1E4TQG6_PACTA|nr:hypothetical protein PACTADRAFT_4815 [Pachysolen tannophilus NRRL Y-2460]